ncbi:MAG: ATP-binding protein [Blautia sp.]|nr:ATP-binding protein [Blautia sp.]
MKGWTLHVNHLGKIEEADIRIAPLTLFIGDNNSGKSYIMTVLYGLLNVRFYYDHYQVSEDGEAYRKCLGILEKILETVDRDTKGMYVVSGDEIRSFQTLLNEILRENKDKFLQQFFRREMSCGQLSVEFPEDYQAEIRVKKTLNEENRPEEVSIAICDDAGTRMTGFRINVHENKEEDDRCFLIVGILQSLLRKGFRNLQSAGTIYMPTARTGFLLTYKAIIGEALKHKFGEETADTALLTRPTSDFLQILSSMNVEEQMHTHDEVLQYIEENMICGKIDISNLPTHDILYTPVGEDKQLPMYVSSAVVTEVAPLIMFLRYTKVASLLIEEPEISLHPSLQCVMANVLLRLVNAGVPVFATTHSDLILQQINNAVKLTALAGKNKESILEEMGIEEAELLAPEEMAVYQFEVGKSDKTTVQAAPRTEYGFEADTFYNMLKKLSDQTMHIEEGMED